MIQNAIKYAMMKLKYIYINQQAGNRMPWVDIAKAIAMIAVVLSHEFSSIKPLVLLCNSFMLPLFFMCSGFCLSPGKYNIAEYAKRKAKTLLLPYFALGLIASLSHIGINGLDGVIQNIEKSLFSWQTLWFLPVLFFADFILYTLLSESKNVLFMNILVGTLALIIGTVSCWQNITMIIDLSVVPIAVFYLTVGYGIKLVLKTDYVTHIKLYFWVPLLMICLIVMLFTNSNLILKSNNILPVWKLFLSTMESIGLMLTLSIVITPPAKATWCYPFAGVHRKNTMVVFAFHMPVFFYCQTLLRPLFKSQLCYKPIEFILIWGICLMLIPLFNRYAPILIGKK